MKVRSTLVLFALALSIPGLALCEAALLEPRDVFELEWASDPRISPDGHRIAYVRNSMDIMRDRRHGEIWIADFDGSNHRPLVTGEGSYGSPRWSPNGDRLLYVGSGGDGAQLHVRWMDTGQTARISHLEEGPSGIQWSPDGRWIAFSMQVVERDEPMASMPARPDGAEWADAPRVIDRLIYRADGAGYVDGGYEQIFLLPAEGGTPRQLTDGEFHHGAPLSWMPDGKRLVFSANRRDDWEYEPNDSEVYALDIASGNLTPLTDRRGPDNGPVVSPDGSRIAYLGFDDRYEGYQVRRLYVMDSDGGSSRLVSGDLDRDVERPQWTEDGSGLYIAYAEHGDTKLAVIDLSGQVEEIADRVGGLSLGRPYSGGTFHTRGRQFVFTHTTPEHPADLASGRTGSTELNRVTRLNSDLFAGKELAAVEELWVDSSFDGRSVQGWLALPPEAEAGAKLPLILEIHGGPFANYGARFSAEVQLYAAAGYAVLYVNPRGSTSYGKEFGNLIHHNYPGEDYDDLMSMVDAVIERGVADPDRLFVTGGSGGGVLTAWIVGKTDRFRAAVSAKPVINWTSFVFTADAYNFFYRYWFPGLPWEDPEQYWRRSPLSLAGNVTTPTMLLTGEADYRTPMSESEQFYQALKLQRVDAALVRIPGASHGIARRPSQLIAKVAHILAWFENHDVSSDD